MNYLRLIGILLVFFIGQVIRLPVQNLTGYEFSNTLVSYHWSKIIVGLVLILFFVISISKSGLLKFNYQASNPVKNSTYLKVLFLIVLINSYVITGYLYLDGYLLMLVLFSTYVTAISEEFCFRGLILPILMRQQIKKDNFIQVGVLISSLIFGLFHFMNLKAQPENIIGISHQVYAAIGVGIFSSYILLRIKNIIVVGVFHGTLNVLLNQSRFDEIKVGKKSLSEPGYSFELLTTIFTVSVITLFAFYFFRKLSDIDSEKLKSVLPIDRNTVS
ncbi:MAG: CPBP family intramembrane glutamic endopeptidase [Balneolaceae bacterium]